jgi:hypothetical protein
MHDLNDSELEKCHDELYKKSAFALFAPGKFRQASTVPAYNLTEAFKCFAT